MVDGRFMGKVQDPTPFAGGCERRLAGDTSDLSCVVVRSDAQSGKQGHIFALGTSAWSTGSPGLCLYRLLIPAGTQGRPYLHAGHESAIYIVAGRAEAWIGPELHEHLVVKAGDFLVRSPGRPAHAGEHRQ
ncbi:cupin [Kitasatospora sp. NPDC058046]|uniref:cupin n=1 Tax=Kitasatospora sp. NPDC058046 TaxID=3346312 RepID=UPI0036DA7DA9